MKGKIKVKSIIEIVGSPKEYIEQSMSLVTQKLKERKDMAIINHKVFEAKKIQDKPFWSTFCDVEFETESIESLMTYCFDFLPSSIEIIEPSAFNLQNFNVNNLLNDMLAKLHQYNMDVKNQQAANIILKRENARLKEPPKKDKQ